MPRSGGGDSLWGGGVAWFAWRIACKESALRRERARLASICPMYASCPALVIRPGYEYSEPLGGSTK